MYNIPGFTMKVLLEYVQVESIYRNFELRNQDIFIVGSLSFFFALISLFCPMLMCFHFWLLIES